MGGSAFLKHSPTINIPRMPPVVFEVVLQSTLNVLRKHYGHCASSIEAPGKTTFGDVDILVASPYEMSFNPFREASGVTSPTKGSLTPVAENLKAVLQATTYIIQPGNPTVNLAIPWPKDLDGDEEYHTQIDVHHLDTKAQWEWEMFHSAHGDLWNILGSTIRPFGLTANDIGLYLRIEDIEQLDRKKSMIFLTSVPSEVLKLLALDEDVYWKEFGSQEEMFQFATSCRMFWVKENSSEGAEGDVFGEIEGQEGGEKGKKKLKHNDRQRVRKRPIFQAWIEEFIPRLRKEGGHVEAKSTRDKIRAEAFEMFNVGEEYQRRLTEWKLARHRDELWRDIIKGGVPDNDEIDVMFRSAATRMLKAFIMEGEDFDGTISPASKTDKDGFHDIAAVKAFVEANWEKAGKIGMARKTIKSQASMAVKEEKRKKRKAAKKQEIAKNLRDAEEREKENTVEMKVKIIVKETAVAKDGQDETAMFSTPA
ncbi:hypothetical protein BJ875DRAFT_462136 [Amylocarpus encephaloides]|uniref:Uncharacterized protein n=1 Tax=Amylocarpus encephaloides TaxID=45428 RepID=A0A9P7YIP2_9HELO|nr:hypothetical protein BJ875DRAFT_462136 [Amylocarpus encephaloides]